MARDGRGALISRISQRSMLVRSCTPLSKSEEKERLLATYSTMLYVEFTQVHYIDFSEIVQLVKASIIVITVHFEISTLFVVSHFSSFKVSPEMEVKPGLFWDPEKVSLQ